MDWRHRYYEVENQDGERCIIDRSNSLGRYKKMARGFENYSRIHGYTFYKHITLTQGKESYSPKFLNSFFMAMKRRYRSVVYIWCSEVQEERLAASGESVLHYHIVMAFEYGTQFKKEDILKIQSYWKYGNADVRPVRNRKILSYIMKYVSKSLNSPLLYLMGIKVRKIGMSKTGQIYRHTMKNFCRIIQWFQYDFSEIGKFMKVDKNGIYYNYRCEVFGNWKKDYALIVSKWRVIDTFEECPGEPF